MRLLAKLIFCFVIFPTAAHGQALSKRALAAREKVIHLPQHAKISIIKVHGPEAFGTLGSCDTSTFEFYDVDRKMNVTVSYEDVKKVKEGYGGYNSATRTHVDRRSGLIVMCAVFAGIAALIATAVVSMK